MGSSISMYRHPICPFSPAAFTKANQVAEYGDYIIHHVLVVPQVPQAGSSVTCRFLYLSVQPEDRIAESPLNGWAFAILVNRRWITKVCRCEQARGLQIVNEMVLREIFSPKRDSLDDFEDPKALEKEDCLSCRVLGKPPSAFSLLLSLSIMRPPDFGT